MRNQLSPEELTAQILSTIAETQELPRDRIQLDSSFAELGIDSLNGFNLLCELEEMLDISIPDEDARQVSSVKELVECVVPLAAAAGAVSPGQTSSQHAG